MVVTISCNDVEDDSGEEFFEINGNMIDITRPYFEKHGEYIEARGLELVGKRIFVRVREESGVGRALFEARNAVVPPPNVSAKAPKKH